MPWLTERLTPAPDGTNRIFAVTYTPLRWSTYLVVGGPGNPLMLTTRTPRGARYRFTGRQVELGLAPEVSQHPWIRYFYEVTGDGPFDAGAFDPGAFNTEL